MSNTIPLISSGTAGPLGILHLPRLWLKASLGAAGKLHPDYSATGPGYDLMVLDALGIEKSAFETFIAKSKPTYPELEVWVVSNSAASLDPGAIADLNAAIAGYQHSDEIRTRILSECGLPDDGKILDAVSLNNLDDWQGYYKEVLA
jgi:hypothetical protein